VIAGVHRPTEGAVFLGNTRLDRLPAYQIPRRGVALAHQVPRPFRGLTVHDNVLVGAEAAGVGSGRGDVSEILDRCALGPQANRPARELGVLNLKRLEVARALATRPRGLMLDEVAAGLAGHELDQLIELVSSLHRSGLTILLVEHVERLVRSVVDRVLVLDWGKLIGDGTPAEVGEDSRVREVYLGGGHTPASTWPREIRRSAERSGYQLLILDQVSAGYGSATALHELTMKVEAGEVVAVLGSNGAGKSTLCSTVGGLLPAWSGRLTFGGTDITQFPAHRRTRLGIAHCPEGRRLFGRLSVRQNLELGARHGASRADVARRVELVMDIFPTLRDKLGGPARMLSGGSNRWSLSPAHSCRNHC
jgi:branched-chain amino acid transport system ATP-binding protein